MLTCCTCTFISEVQEGSHIQHYKSNIFLHVQFIQINTDKNKLDQIPLKNALLQQLKDCFKKEGNRKRVK